MNFKEKFIIVSLFLFGCQSTPQEIITSENARIDAIQLLQDLQFDYKGIHCGQPILTFYSDQNQVICDVSTKSESAIVKCKLHDCYLIEKKAFRIKFGITK